MKISIRNLGAGIKSIHRIRSMSYRTFGLPCMCLWAARYLFHAFRPDCDMCTCVICARSR